jgi:hypothetical protein
MNHAGRMLDRAKLSVSKKAPPPVSKKKKKKRRSH